MSDDGLSPDDSLPGEAALLDYIESCPKPPSLRDVARAFKIGQEHRSALRQRLRQMAENGTINGDRRGVSTSDALPEVSVLEIISFNDDGDGLARVAVDNSENPLKIHVLLSRKSGRVPAVGQQILARLSRIGKTEYEARIIRLLDRHQKRLFGVVVASSKGFRLQPADRGKRDSLTLEADAATKLLAGDLVEAEMLPSKGYLGKTAKVITNLGNTEEPGAFSALAIAEFNIRHQFPDAAIAESEGLKVPPIKGRWDLREHALVTIDGADARDFDDAVYAAPTDDGGWHLLIAIADVAHYVRPDSALDREGQKRGNSVYFPDRVVPMLPEAISNDLCSLRPHEDRAAMVAEIYIDQHGKRLSHKIERALIRSHARLTYDQVQAVFDGVLDEADCGVQHGCLHALNGAWQALNIDRQAREPLALNLKERRVLMDDNGKPSAITQTSQSASQRLIEDFMIAANVVAAETLIAGKKPCVFRVHDTPDPKKAAGLTKLAETLGGNFTSGQVLRPYHFNKIIALAANTPDEITVNETVLRSQAKAVYSIDNIGHFGLSLRNYAHFTSPIRRYSDLLVHRALIDLISAQTPTSKAGPKDGLNGMPIDQIAEICVAISETESTAAAAERRTIDRFAATLFASRIGAVVDGVIAAITGFGAFVRLEDGAADGLLPLRAFPDDYYDFDEQNQCLEGRHNGWKFVAGSKLQVKITEVTPVSGGILLDWVSGGLQDDRPSRKRPKPADSHRHAKGKNPGTRRGKNTKQKRR